MKLITTLSALLFTACTVPGLQMGSTFSSGSSSTPASYAPASAPVPASDSTSSSGAVLPVSSLQPAPFTSGELYPIDQAAKWVDKIATGETRPGGGTHEYDLHSQATSCSQDVDELLKNGHPRSQKLALKDGEVALGEAEDKICQKLAKATENWDKRSKAAFAARVAADVEPYRKAGVEGDKLKLVGNLGQQLIGPKQADPTPAVVARASVLFSLRDEGERMDGGHNWTIVRYAFKGNQQVSVTEKGYHDRPGPESYR